MNPGPPTGNPFPALRDYARDHPSGSKDPLKFQPDVALRLAANASSVIMGIGMLRQLTEDLTIGAPVSNLGSGTALGTKFGAKATDLDKVLGDHKDILADMIDTFISAGKAYGNMDGFNSALLDNVSSHPTEIWDLNPDGPPATTLPPARPSGDREFADLPTGLAGLGAFDQSTIMGESADSLSWLDLWQVGNFIRVRGVVTNLSDHSGTWRWMAGEVNRVFVDFTNSVDSVTAEQWSGPGKEVAVAAVKAYAGSIPKLTTTITGVADLLFYTAGWLDATQKAMPTTADNPAGDISVSGGYMTGYGTYVGPTVLTAPDTTPTYRENFRRTYLTGLNQSATHVPVIPPAQGAFNQVPTDPYNPTGSNDPRGGGGDPRGGGGGPQGGGGGPQGGGGGPKPELAAATQSYDSAAAQQAAQAQQAALAQQQAGLEQIAGLQLPGDNGGPGAGQTQGLPSQIAAALSQVPGADKVAALAQEAATGTPEQQVIAQAAQQLLTAAQQGLPQLLQAFQQLGQTLTQEQQRQALEKAGLAGIPGLDLTDPEQLAALEAAAAGAGGGGAGGGGAGGGGMGGGVGTAALPLTHDPAQASKLFPRVAALSFGAETAVEAPGKAGAAATAGTPGSPGSPGAAGAGAGGQNNQHKRATYLESTEYLEDAIGEAPVVVRPVVER